MKTILVVYTNSKVTSTKDIARYKRYSFNTASDLKVGDMIKTKEYDTNIQVVKILDEAFKYYNSSTGELSNNFNSSSQWEIRTLEIREESDTIIYGSKIESK